MILAWRLVLIDTTHCKLISAYSCSCVRGRWRKRRLLDGGGGEQTGVGAYRQTGKHLPECLRELVDELGGDWSRIRDESGRYENPEK